MNETILLVGFDGLRPDLITETHMPNLSRFMASGAMLANHRSVFPSETRVNLTSLSTGSWPESHGLVANRFVDHKLPDLPYVDTSRADNIDAGQRAYDGAFIGATSLAEAVASGGETVCVIATGSSGSTRLLGHSISAAPHLSFSCAAPETSRPQGTAKQLIEAAGPPPERGVPATRIVQYATDLFLSHVYPQMRPRVAILWFVEPDTSFHYIGLERSDEVLAFVDAEFGRILDWAESQPDLQIIAMSDHGHVRQDWPMDVPDTLKGLGANIASRLDPDADLIVLPGQVTRVWANPGKKDLLKDVGAALMEAPWSGPIFAKDPGLVPGSFSQKTARLMHPRAPDLYCARYADSGSGCGNLPGRGYFLEGDGLPQGAGHHGGLQREEMTSFAALSGTLFKQAFQSTVPSGIVDIAPTILYALGLPRPVSMTGRPLCEVMRETPRVTESIKSEVIESGSGSYRQRLLRRHVGEATYLDHAYRVMTAPAAALVGE